MQHFQNFEIIVVNDGSTDHSQERIEKFISESPIAGRISLLNLQQSTHQPGAKVVRTFNAGLDYANVGEFDILCKFDADIIFPDNYLHKINSVFEKNPKAGIVSGIVKIKNEVLDYQSAYDFDNKKNYWKFENISSKNHVRGPIKAYRKECFDEMQGLRPVLGWDNIDVMLAEMHGWEVITIKDLWVKHLRPTAFQYKAQKAEKLGEYFYNIGLSYPLTLTSALKSAWKSKSASEFFNIVKSYSKQNHELTLTADEVKYIRNLRKKTLLGKIGL